MGSYIYTTDGNSFYTPTAYEKLKGTLLASAVEVPYFEVPGARGNACLIKVSNITCIEQELPKHGEENSIMLGYNENGRLSEFEENNSIVKCSHCNKKYIQEQIDQMPGFREVDEDICPYCYAVNGRSGEVDYLNYKINESDEER